MNGKLIGLIIALGVMLFAVALWVVKKIHDRNVSIQMAFFRVIKD